ncbi:Metalloprotease TIKI1, partial [Goodea atripinnis]
VPNFNNVTLPPSEQVTAQEIDAYFRLELIYKRNERMGRRVKALLEEQPDKSFFFAFGAGWSSLINMKNNMESKCNHVFFRAK